MTQSPNIIHDVIRTAHPFPYTAKFMLVSVINNKTSDHFGPRLCAIGTNLSPMAHENMTCGTKMARKNSGWRKVLP